MHGGGTRSGDASSPSATSARTRSLRSERTVTRTRSPGNAPSTSTTRPSSARASAAPPGTIAVVSTSMVRAVVCSFMADERVTGRAHVTEQYADGTNLAARQSIYAYQQPLIDLWGRAYELAAMRGGEALLDVGCGNGRYVSEFRRRGHTGPSIAMDLSPGMLAGVVADGRCVADAEAIPTRDACADVTL